MPLRNLLSVERFEGHLWAALFLVPHKPLLLLLALAALARGEEACLERYEGKLIELLREYGPSSKSFHPEYPFWRLQNDGLWLALCHRRSNSDPPKSQLRSSGAIGRFPDEIRVPLLQNPSLIPKGR